MDQLEKVEKLRERANVSYEEARKALEEHNWDLLDAMVALEQQGKVQQPENGSYSTNFQQQMQYQYPSVQQTVYQQEQKNSEGFWSKCKRGVKKLWKVSKENYFRVLNNGEELFKMPVWAFAILFFFFWELVTILMIVGLFMGCHYSFVGQNDLSGVNDAMEKASDFADKVKDECKKL